MRFLLGLLVGAVVVLSAEYLFLTRGGMPVASLRAKPLPLERFVASQALHAAVADEENRPSPVQPDERNLLSGARVYSAHCALCHGVTGQAPSAVAIGMFPRPPDLMPPGKGVTDDPVGETHWKVMNGIRMTGMPAFEGSLPSEAMWQVSLLLLKAHELPPSVVEALR